MADWDPFAVDETPAAEAPSAAAAAPQAVVAGRISEADLEKVKEEGWRRLLAQAPWQKSPDPRPDLRWHRPTCTFESWSHTDVKVEIGDGIAYISFNRPTEDNPLSEGAIAALCDAIFLLHERKDLRVAVFSGEGRLFCAGSPAGSAGGGFSRSAPAPDVQKARSGLVERAVQSGLFPDGRVNIGRLLMAKLWHTWATLPQFTIALVNGSVIGDGLGCVACCDMAISVRSAFLSLPEVREGSLACIVAPYVVAKVGTGNARRVYGIGENISAEKALSMGLINEVVDDVAAGHKFIGEICTVLTACGPRSVEAAKQLVLGVGGQPITEPLMFYTSAMLAMVTISDEARDGMKALQARLPKPWEEKPIQPLR